MKCPKCNIVNDEGAKFCRNCGGELVYKEQSIREKYPEYSFEPTSVTKIKGNSSWKILVVLFSTLIVASIVCMINAFAQDLEVFSTGIKIGWLFLISALVFFFLLKKSHNSVKKVDISSQYDFIECRNSASQYRFVVKNSKFGLLNVKTKKAQVQCDYDYLKWTLQDKILTATLNGSQFEIDINGKKLN